MLENAKASEQKRIDAAQALEDERQARISALIKVAQSKMKPRLTEAQEAWRHDGDLRISYNDPDHPPRYRETMYEICSIYMVNSRISTPVYEVTLTSYDQLVVFERSGAKNYINTGARTIDQLSEEAVDKVLERVAADFARATMREE